MSVGYPINKAVLDSRSGYIVKTLRDTLAQAVTLKAVLDGLTTEDLVAMGYTEAEVAVLKSGITDLTALSAVANGQQAQAAASDFFFWADRLTGVE